MTTLTFPTLDNTLRHLKGRKVTLSSVDWTESALLNGHTPKCPNSIYFRWNREYTFGECALKVNITGGVVRPTAPFKVSLIGDKGVVREWQGEVFDLPTTHYMSYESIRGSGAKIEFMALGGKLEI